MKISPLFAAIALTVAAAAGPVLAQEATYEYPQKISSQTTRAAVLADLKQARSEGRLHIDEARVGYDSPMGAARSRESVRAEAQTAVRSGQNASLTADPHGFDVAVPKAAKPMKVSLK